VYNNLISYKVNLDFYYCLAVKFLLERYSMCFSEHGCNGSWIFSLFHSPLY
jgi:hypothetical protein